MSDKQIAAFSPANPEHWRNWLERNHALTESVWLIYSKKHTGIPTVTWSETVDEALCFGWIDSLFKPLNDEQFMRLFTKRKPKSVWSAVNKEKVDRLIVNGRMREAGFAAVAVAKQNGSWSMLNDVDALFIPDELTEALQQQPDADTYFSFLSNSSKKSILQWLRMASRSETRQKRIAEIVDCAARGTKPKAVSWSRK
jgi:uncharacterized protein YdeI (YjbR/CyaY-like superfamily)